MTQKQYDKHARENLGTGVLETPRLPVYVPPVASGLRFTAPDAQWVSRKQRATQFGDEKTRPAGDKPEWGTVKEELVPESIQEFVDKHIKDVLSRTEEGRAFLEENPDGPTPRS